MTQADLSHLSEYWYDRVALQQQSNAALRFLPDARTIWEAAQAQHLLQPNTVAYVALVEAQVLAGLVMTIEANAPGLAPPQIGVLREFLIDLHTTHRRQPLMSAVLAAAQDDLVAQGVEQYRVSVSIGLSVEQTFWRGRGARKSDDLFWISL